MRAVVVPVEGPVVPLDIPDKNALGVLQSAVEGMIEALPFPYREGDKAAVYVNEEGKFSCLDDDGNVEVNRRATALMKPGIGLFLGDFIAGPMVIAGFDPRTGEHIDLDERRLRRAARFRAGGGGSVSRTPAFPGSCCQDFWPCSAGGRSDAGPR